jgi:hypothetical protein
VFCEIREGARFAFSREGRAQTAVAAGIGSAVAAIPTVALIVGGGGPVEMACQAVTVAGGMIVAAAPAFWQTLAIRDARKHFPQLG